MGIARVAPVPLYMYRKRAYSGVCRAGACPYDPRSKFCCGMKAVDLLHIFKNPRRDDFGRAAGGFFRRLKDQLYRSLKFFAVVPLSIIAAPSMAVR